MSAPVISLIPNTAIAVDHQQLAARLRNLADSLQAGDLGEVERVVVVLEASDRVDHRVYGRPTTAMELVGLLEWAKHKVIAGDPEE